MFAFNDDGLYICVDCGEPYSPGHSLRCKKQSKQSEDSKVNRVLNIGKHIDVGMRMIHASEDDGFFDITEFTARGRR